jgi:hypothetical protein
VERNALKGETYYRKKVLNGVDLESISDPYNGSSECLKNIWVFKAAREYGVILWSKAVSEQNLSEARRWVSLAARAGDQPARDILTRMTSGDQRTKNPLPMIAENPVNPHLDATALKRDVGFFYPYIQMDIKDIYAKSRAGQIITSISIREGSGQNASGENLWELFIQYKRLATRTAVGFSGVLLMGVEFEDTETGEMYWTFNESPDSNASRIEDSYTDVSLFVNLSGHPHVQVSNWAVVYGHRFDDDLTLVAFDERQKSAKTGSLDQMVFRNQYSLKLKSTVVVTENISGIIQSAQPTSVKSDSDSESGSSSTLDSILSTLGLGE